MTLTTIIFSLLFLPNAFANSCAFENKDLWNLQKDERFEMEYSVKIPIPDKVLKIIEKIFGGNFSKKSCREAIEVTKIIDKKISEYYLAFYTNANACDGGNSYGIIVKEKDKDFQKPYATIEDSYIDCASY